MKRFATLIIIISFFLSGTAYGTTLFQRLNDNISKMGKPRVGHKQTEWTSIFRKSKRNISAFGKGSSRHLSLRGNYAELARRRGL